jgi:hypothetical protein
MANAGRALQRDMNMTLRDIQTLKFVQSDPKLSKAMSRTIMKRWDRARHEQYQEGLNDGDVTTEVINHGGSVQSCLVDNRTFLSHDSRDNGMKQKLWVKGMNG